MELKEIEHKIACNELNAAQVFTQMMQHIKPMPSTQADQTNFCDPQRTPEPDEYGLFFHPDLNLIYSKLEAAIDDSFATYELLQEVISFAGYEYESVSITENSTQENINAYYEDESISQVEFIKRWDYKPKDHLNLVGIDGTDDGELFALFVGKKPIIEEPA